MKKYLSFIILSIALILGSCTSYKRVPYIQNSADIDLTPGTQLYDAKIMPKDQFTITVINPVDNDAVQIFNLTLSSMSKNGGGSMNSQQSLIPYTVDNNGDIQFPILGKIHAAGMTKHELEEYIASHIHGAYTVDKPVVTVNFTNFKISVLGEVAGPGVYNVNNGKINIFEALAMAHDLTIYGRRDCIKLIRESERGEKKIVELDLNNADIINSPYYQLQQNDIVYVTPNKTKAKNSGIGAETSLWFSATSILISVTSLLFNILK